VQSIRHLSVFQSDGGYRIAQVMIFGEPVISACPWFSRVEDIDEYVRQYAAELVEKSFKDVVCQRMFNGQWKVKNIKASPLDNSELTITRFFDSKKEADAFIEERRKAAMGVIWKAYLEANNRL